MTQSVLAKKLGIKPGQRLLVLNAPAGYESQLAPLPENANVLVAATPAEYDAAAQAGLFDFVQGFVRHQADLDALADLALGALTPGGLLWFAYPKISAKTGSDITRDTGWDRLHAAGFQGVSLVAVDATWSAMRFRPVADSKPRRTSDQ
jgi:hypothetical protein